MTAHTRMIDSRTLADRARSFIDARRLTAARPLLAALQRLDPEPSEFAELEARLLIHEGRDEQALAVLDAALARDADNIVLRLDRAELRLKRGDLHLGADDAAAAVMADPRNPLANATLGVALVRLARAEEAVICLAQAVRIAPHHAGYRKALAEAQEAAGDLAGAVQTFDAALADSPANLPLRTAAILVAIRHRDFERAIILAEAARAAGTADASVLGMLGHALSSVGRHAAAADAYAEALTLAPEDEYVRQLVRSADLPADATRAPADYVAAAFDGYASRFEQHLLDLGYRIPGVIRRLVHDLYAGATFPRHVLDLGCGTGLVAVALSDLPIGPITGIDLSARMLAEAEKKSLYAALVRADIQDALVQDAAQWDLITAADVMNYFGELGAIFAAVRARLAPGGRYLASFETLEAGAEANWRLGRQGKFAHGREYIRAAAQQAGLNVHQLAPELIRLDGGAPVEGVVGVFEPVAL